MAGCGRLNFANRTIDDSNRINDGELPDTLRCAGPDADLDGVGDSCDNCPTMANIDQANAREIANGQAADQLGDACDPFPEQSGDRIVSVEYFDDGVPATMIVQGTVTGVPGGVRVGSLTAGGSLDLNLTSSVTRIEMSYRVLATSDVNQWSGPWLFLTSRFNYTGGLNAHSTWNPADRPLESRLTINEFATAHTVVTSATAIGPRFFVGQRVLQWVDIKPNGEITIQGTSGTGLSQASAQLVATLSRTTFASIESAKMQSEYDYIIMYGR
jgi:hypothetical protein